MNIQNIPLTEIHALHCDLIVRRWEQFTGEQAIRL